MKNLKSIADIPANWKFIRCKKKPLRPIAYEADEECYIQTLEGVMKANKGDIIIEGAKKEIYPCKKEIFCETYDLIIKEKETRELTDVFKVGDSYTVTKDWEKDNPEEHGFYVEGGFPQEVIDTEGAIGALYLIKCAWDRQDKDLIHVDFKT